MPPPKWFFDQPSTPPPLKKRGGGEKRPTPERGPPFFVVHRSQKKRKSAKKKRRQSVLPKGGGGKGSTPPERVSQLLFKAETPFPSPPRAKKKDGGKRFSMDQKEERRKTKERKVRTRHRRPSRNWLDGSALPEKKKKRGKIGGKRGKGAGPGQFRPKGKGEKGPAPGKQEKPIDFAEGEKRDQPPRPADHLMNKKRGKKRGKEGKENHQTEQSRNCRRGVACSPKEGEKKEGRGGKREKPQPRAQLRRSCSGWNVPPRKGGGGNGGEEVDLL